MKKIMYLSFYICISMIKLSAEQSQQNILLLAERNIEQCIKHSLQAIAKEQEGSQAFIDAVDDFNQCFNAAKNIDGYRPLINKILSR